MQGFSFGNKKWFEKSNLTKKNQQLERNGFDRF
jgi:hypothetical protein